MPVYVGINWHKLVFDTDWQKLGLCRHFANPDCSFPLFPIFRFPRPKVVTERNFLYSGRGEWRMEREGERGGERNAFSVSRDSNDKFVDIKSIQQSKENKET